jgi:hypothetical protein
MIPTRPSKEKFTAYAKRIDIDYVVTCKTGRNSAEHRAEEVHLDLTQED